MRRVSALDIIDNSIHHIDDRLLFRVLARKLLRTVLASDVPHNSSALRELKVTVNQVWEVGKVKPKRVFDSKPAFL